jgi:glutaryl-CoA dehydrogenase
MTTAHAKKNVAPPDAVDFLGLDALLSSEERLVRDTIRTFVRERVLPNVAEWFEEGVLPQQLGAELGKLGVLGMHLEGYDCPGASAVAYGLACMELEAGDSGVRSFASVQGVTRDVCDSSLGYPGTEKRVAAADGARSEDRLLRAH